MMPWEIALTGLLAPILVVLFIFFVRKRRPRKERAIISVCFVAGIWIYLAGRLFTEISNSVLILTLIIVGVVLPSIILRIDPLTE